MFLIIQFTLRPPFGWSTCPDASDAVADGVFLFPHGEKKSISGRRGRCVPAGGARSAKKTQFSSKKCFLAVDGRIGPDTLLTPPEAGLPGRKTRELVLAYFGTANWNSILSRFITP
jgi:hypothetical protein